MVDSGPGIPSHQKTRIFEPFHRGSAERKRSIKGTGLGLAISRGIVEAHGGRIWVEDNPAGGSVFKFQLPI